MELRNSRVETILEPAPGTNVQPLLLRRDERPGGPDGGDPAVLRAGIAITRKITPQWVQASLFDRASARLLVGPSGELLWASDAAEEIVQISGCFRIEHGRLSGATRRVQAQLEALLAEAGEAEVAEALVAADEDSEASLYVAARATPGPKVGTVALVVREVGRANIAMPDLTRLFGLTQTENHIVGMLLNGMSVAEIAERQNNSQLTVRTHLKRSYSKMCIRTKEQLFAKLLRLMTD